MMNTMMIRGRATVAGAAAVVIVFLAGCCVSTPTKTPAGDATSRAAAAASGDADARVAKIGAEAFRYQDGLSVSVPTAQRFTFSDTAAGAAAGTVGVKVLVRVVNGTGNVVDLTLTSAELTSGTPGAMASRVFDSDNQIGTGISGKVLSGRTVEAWYGFAVDPARLGRVDVEVRPGPISYSSVMFTGSVS